MSRARADLYAKAYHACKDSTDDVKMAERALWAFCLVLLQLRLCCTKPQGV